MRYILIDHIAELPVLADVDVCIVGGGCAAVAAAETLARQSLNIMLVEAKTFLGGDMTMGQQPWAALTEATRPLAEKFFPLPAPGDTIGCGERTVYLMDSLKRKLEDVLMIAGVRLLYSSRLIQLDWDEDGYTLVFANRAGRQNVRCQKLLDFTEEGICQRLLSEVQTEEVRDLSVTTRFTFTVEFTSVSMMNCGFLPLPEGFRLCGNRIELVRGAFDEGHVFAIVSQDVRTTVKSTYSESLRIAKQLRAVCLAVAEYLIKNHPAFHAADIGLMSTMPVRGIFDALGQLQEGIRRATQLLANEASSNNINVKAVEDGQKIDVSFEGIFVEHNEFAGWHSGKFLSSRLYKLPLLCTADVLVVGGGTAGSVAALAAARKGVQTVVVEMNHILGGTSTVGAVQMHWLGNPSEFSLEIDQKTCAMHRRLGLPVKHLDYNREDAAGKTYVWSKELVWSTELKAQTLMELCDEADAETMTDCTVFGVIKCGNTVKGVAVATPYGSGILLAKTIIDASGDGDLAALAGASYRYGNERDRMTMWSAMSPYRRPGIYSGNFFAVVDVTDPLDMTRFILTARCRPGGRMNDHAAYVATRESRHIMGDCQLTLKDQLLLRQFDDTVSIAFSNYDLKGKSAADIVYMGINQPNLDIEIPYRTLLPKDLDGLLVCGKAISMSHDALAAPRMQKDVQQLGGAAGLAAAMAVLGGIPPRQLPVRALQSELIRTGNLHLRVHNRPSVESTRAERIEAIIEALTGEEETQWLEMPSKERATAVPAVVQVYYADPIKAIPLLRQVYEKAEGKRKLLLARMLAWHGLQDGLPCLIAEIGRELAQSQDLPRRLGDVYFIVMPPDQGIMPEILYLYYALSRLKTEAVLPAFRDLTERICSVERDYIDPRICSFDYIGCVAYAAERLCFAAFIPLLQRLLALPELQNLTLDKGIEANIVKERLAYLTLCLHRALARCGDRRGYLGMAKQLADVRTFIAKSAYEELVALTGMKFAAVPDAWIVWIMQQETAFLVRPWVLTID